ncbi:MAG: 2-C-methyl-D-erythritol 4-phosphate cytidylyltransferase [Lachnospiraceae bacterium]|nr:2-C-methyl-D-erythritol 4-phosphate cytidylyltransferase [Lachnospiraceae bacterium]MDE6627003.1 2-C-methyl-D-erythritol 4-phosphate cytidylyltransferase [Lachnospiraceae bacterium]
MEKSNVYGVILAGGKGTRMGNVEKPKQFMELGGKPIIVHTIEKFIMNTEFCGILVLTPKQWIKHTQDLIRKYIPADDRIQVIEGGDTRNETIMNAISHIEGNGMLEENTVIVTHDSVRPFVTHRILEENIRYAKEYGACDTVIPATDTIVESKDHQMISDIPDRSVMYQGQTPQSFKAKHLKTIYESLTEEEKKILTDACKILVMKGENVHLVEGEESNIKITYPYDLRVAEALLGGV